MIKLSSLKWKPFVFQKTPLRQWKDNKLEKIFAEHISDKKTYMCMCICDMLYNIYYLQKPFEVVLGECASWATGLLRQLAGSNVLLCQHGLSGLISKGWALRTKGGSHLIYPCKQVIEAKTRSNPYVVIFTFIGYFTLVLCDFPLSGAVWPSSCSDFQVLSLCYAIPSSLVLSQDSDLDCFLLILLPATSFPPFAARTHARSKNIISI
jgi:hypothetical protein